VSSATKSPGQEIRNRAFEFACRITAFCETLCQQGGVARLMAPQLLNSGTAVAAMMEEAKAAESHRDFVSK
jgi:four helix bundle protein